MWSSEMSSHTYQTTMVVFITAYTQTSQQKVMGPIWGLDSVKTKQGVQGDSYDMEWYIHIATLTIIHF